MDLTIRAANVKAGKKLSDSIKEKFGKLERVYERILFCSVSIAKEKNAQQKNCFVEAKLEMPKKILFASDRAESFELAIDKVVEALEQQIIRYKEQIQDARSIREKY